jgi:hypothetical protein
MRHDQRDVASLANHRLLSVNEALVRLARMRMHVGDDTTRTMQAFGKHTGIHASIERNAS